LLTPRGLTGCFGWLTGDDSECEFRRYRAPPEPRPDEVRCCHTAEVLLLTSLRQLLTLEPDVRLRAGERYPAPRIWSHHHGASLRLPRAPAHAGSRPGLVGSPVPSRLASQAEQWICCPVVGRSERVARISSASALSTSQSRCCWSQSACIVDFRTVQGIAGRARHRGAPVMKTALKRCLPEGATPMAATDDRAACECRR
jgi:hypothetical protein